MRTKLFCLLVSGLVFLSCKKNNLTSEEDFEGFPTEITIPANTDIIQKYTFYLKDKDYNKDIVAIKISKGNVFRVEETNFSQDTKSIEVPIEDKKIEFYVKPTDTPDDYVSLSIAIRSSNFAVPVKFTRLYPDTAYFDFSKTEFDTTVTEINFKVNLINRKLNKVSNDLTVFFNIDSIQSKYDTAQCQAGLSPYIKATLAENVLVANNILKAQSQQKGTVFLSANYPVKKDSFITIKKTIIWK